jgi:hypothetical protein
VDAFAYQYLKKINFLSDLQKEISPLETLVGYSSTIIPAIWSGKYPEESELWTEFYYSQRKPYKLLKFFSAIPDSRIKMLSKTAFLESFQKFGYYQETLPGIPESIEYLFSRNDIRYWNFPPIDMKCETFDKILKRCKIPYHFEFYKNKVDGQNMLKRLRALCLTRKVFIYYIATIDAMGHKYGPYPNKFEKEIKNLEETIVTAYTILSKQYAVDLFVFSDHGMTKVEKRSNIGKMLEDHELGKDYLMFLDSTLARFWFKDFSAHALQLEFVEILDKSGVGHVLTKEETKKYRLRFKDNRYGDLIFISNPGVELYPNFMNPAVLHQNSITKGLHGYLPEEPSTQGIFMYQGDKELRINGRIKATEVLDKLKMTLNDGSS